MNVLLAAINAKYIHSNLAVYSLKAYAEEKWDSRQDKRKYRKIQSRSLRSRNIRSIRP